MQRREWFKALPAAMAGAWALVHGKPTPEKPTTSPVLRVVDAKDGYCYVTFNTTSAAANTFAVRHWHTT